MSRKRTFTECIVWAIDEWHQPLYLFPRDCPRIVVWANEGSTPEDRAAWCGAGSRMTAYIESESAEAVSRGRVYRYELPPARFEALDDAGMWIARSTVEPISLEPIDDLPRALEAENVELRILPSLAPLRAVWSTTLHASGIRLRHARSWS